MTAQAPVSGELILVILRELAAPIDAVWGALTDPDQAPDWWGPHGFHVPRDSFDTDLEVGGLYRACMIREGTGEKLWWSGVHTDVEPPTLFAFTHAWDRPDGTRGVETEVTFELEEIDGGTRMTFSQGPFGSAEEQDSHAAGWQESFERLADHLSTAA